MGKRRMTKAGKPDRRGTPGWVKDSGDLREDFNAGKKTNAGKRKSRAKELYLKASARKYQKIKDNLFAPGN